MAAGRVPVIAVTGYLGAGKTSLLNHLLRTPEARLGVVINDFGALNVDAALVAGQIDQAASITGGCLCCLPDAGGLDAALSRLAHPRLRLDAILIEASGVADPAVLARVLRRSAASRTRPAGLIDVIDAVEHFATVDAWSTPPLRYAAASLVVVGKTDLLPAGERGAVLERIRGRVRERNPRATVIAARAGRIDPALVFDIAADTETAPMLPLRPAVSVTRDDGGGNGSERIEVVSTGSGRPSGGAGDIDTGHPLGTGHVHVGHHHVGHGRAGSAHARSVSRTLRGPVAPGVLLDLLEHPPAGAYRIKGRVRVPGPRADRGYVVHLVGSMIHLSALAEPPGSGELVIIGPDLDVAAAERALDDVADPRMGHERIAAPMGRGAASAWMGRGAASASMGRDATSASMGRDDGAALRRLERYRRA